MKPYKRKSGGKLLAPANLSSERCRLVRYWIDISGQANPERDAALTIMTQPKLRAKLMRVSASNLGDGIGITF
jgi:hypothetical protein